MSVAIFFASNLASAIYTRQFCTFGINASKCNLFQVTLIRVIVNDSLFVVFGFILSTFLFKLARLSKAFIIPEHDVCSSFLLLIYILFI